MFWHQGQDSLFNLEQISDILRNLKKNNLVCSKFGGFTNVRQLRIREEKVQAQPRSKVYIVSGLYLFQEPSLQLLKSYFTSGPFSNSTRYSQSDET